VSDVRNKLIGKLSKGYRQRVGWASHHSQSDVLILDERHRPRPKQINETRDLIKSLAGDHTIILSTHILPEVSQTCERVIIINKGKVVATIPSATCKIARGPASRCWWKSPAAMQFEFPGRAKEAGAGRWSQPRGRQGRRRAASDLRGRGKKNSAIRADLARAVVESGWDLNELRAAAMSLEEIFLQLTGEEAAAAPAKKSR